LPTHLPAFFPLAGVDPATLHFALKPICGLSRSLCWCYNYCLRDVIHSA
jgi:hypothetical protein